MRDELASRSKAPQLGALLPAMVGAPGFEPGTSSSRTMRATRLRHAPRRGILHHGPRPGPRCRTRIHEAGGFAGRRLQAWAARRSRPESATHRPESTTRALLGLAREVA